MTRLSKIITILAGCILATSVTAFAVPRSLVLAPNTIKLDLAGHMDVLRDPGGELGLDDVAFGSAQDKFVPLPGALVGGYTRDVFWLRFVIERQFDATGPWLMELRPPYLNQIDIYVLPVTASDSTRALHRIVGNHFPVSSRDVKHQNFVLRLDPSALEPQVVYLRLKTITSSTLWGHLWAESAFHESSFSEAIFFGLLFGAMGIMCLLALTFGIWLRDRGFIAFGIYAATAILSTAGLSGQMTIHFLPEQPLLASALVSLSVALNYISWPVLTIVLLEMRTQFPRLIWITRITIMAGVVGLIAIPLGLWGTVANTLLGIGFLHLIMTILLPIVLVKRKVQAAPYMLFGFVAYSLTISLLLLRNLNVIAPSLLTDWSSSIGVVIFELAAMLGLLSRVRRIERERLQANETALAVSRQAEQTLEIKIAERTTDLRILQERTQAALMTEQTALREQRNFVAMVSHEFRTPISITKAAAELVGRLLLPTETVAAGEVARIRRAMLRLTNLIDVCLAEERMDAVTGGLLLRPIKLRDVFVDVSSDMSVITAKPRLQMHIMDDLVIEADQALLQIALHNLLENALKYSPDDAEVDIHVDHSAEGVRIVIRDQGKGIANDDIGMIFDKFYRAPAAVHKPGVGLGLYLVRRIVELHGGDVTVESALGVGSAFTVQLPWSVSLPQRRA